MPLVLVTGPPGSGKSTLARPLADALGWPLISKDSIKEAMADSLSVEGELWSQRLSAAAFDVIFALIPSLPRAVIEGNFYPAARERLSRIDQLVAEIYCRCPIEECRRRFQERPRHAIHHAADLSDGFFGQFEPLAVGPVHEIDTTRPTDLEAILPWVATETGSS